MGSLTFIRASDNSKRSFDSSPQYSLPQMHGYAEGSVELEETNRTDSVITYNVRAATTTGGVVHHVGVLFQKTRAQIRAELGH